MAPSSLPHPLSHADTLTLPTPFAGNTAITASYATSFPRGHLDATKPTILFFHSFTTDTTLFAPQFDDADLTAQANLIAVDLIGHGRTRIGKAGVSRLAEDGLAGGEVGWNDEGVLCRDHWTYWDSAWMALGVLRELGVEKAFVAGTSQGGWVAVRCALLAPEVVLGLIPMGTSMDHESPLSISLGCWNGHAATAGPIAICTSATPTPDFAPPDAYCDYLIDSGLGKDCDPAARQYWTKRVKENYKGDAGRRRMRGAAINLAERDGLYGRLGDIKCPVLWLHGDKDEVYSVKNAEEGLKHFGSEEKRLEVVEGGHHFLSGSSPDVVNPKIAEFASKHWRGGKTVPGRIGTPDVAERVASGI